MTTYNTTYNTTDSARFDYISQENADLLTSLVLDGYDATVFNKLVLSVAAIARLQVKVPEDRELYQNRRYILQSELTEVITVLMNKGMDK